MSAEDELQDELDDLLGIPVADRVRVGSRVPYDGRSLLSPEETARQGRLATERRNEWDQLVQVFGLPAEEDPR